MNAQNFQQASSESYERPTRFADFPENERLWSFNSYLQLLMQLDSQGVEVKREINSCLAAINKIMGI